MRREWGGWAEEGMRAFFEDGDQREAGVRVRGDGGRRRSGMVIVAGDTTDPPSARHNRSKQQKDAGTPPQKLKKREMRQPHSRATNEPWERVQQNNLTVPLSSKRACKPPTTYLHEKTSPGLTETLF